MSRRRVLVGVAFGIVAGGLSAAHAETTPPNGTVDTRIREVSYNPDEVYRLTGFVGYELEFEFSSSERFVALAAGDVKGLSFESEGNYLFLKPAAAGVATNLTILTTLHHYRIAYSVANGSPDAAHGEVTYALRFQYPDMGKPSSQGADPAAEIAQHLSTPAVPLNWNYWYCGPATLRPTAAYDDGLQTHLQFADAGELPALFIRNEDGSESLINFTVTDQEVIVHRVAQQLIMRRGRLVACLVNRSFSGTQQRAIAGTVSPDVNRATRMPALADARGGSGE